MTEFALDARGLRKAFGALLVTDDVSLRLRPGERHALIGPNGAGKTTLVGLLSGVVRLDRGRIRLFDEDLTAADPAARTRRGLVRTFQVSSLFNELTTLENVFLAVAQQRGASLDFWRPAGRRRDLLDQAERLLEQFHLLDQAKRRVAELAYGHQRLVEMAIALALQPKLLMLDEPAAGIPSSEVGILIDAVSRLASDITLLIIEHDMELVRQFATDVTVLVQGRVFISGPMQQVMASDELREVYLGKGRRRQAPSELSHA
jgi:branched-chain amino acid transport system ATP-binding protein